MTNVEKKITDNTGVSKISFTTHLQAIHSREQETKQENESHHYVLLKFLKFVVSLSAALKQLFDQFCNYNEKNIKMDI